MHLAAPKWDGLNRFGKNRALQSSYVWLLIVPIAAKALSAIEDPLVLEGISHGLKITLALPFSWKLFYFSAIAVSGASAIYALACPELISRFNTFAQYRAEGRGREYLEAYVKKLHNEAKTFEQGYASAGDFDLAAQAQEDRDFQALFWKIYAQENNTSPVLRAVCFFLYAFGLLLILVVLLQNLLFVIQTLGKVAQ